MSTHAAEAWAKSPQATPAGIEQKPAVHDYSDVLGGEPRADRALRVAKHLEWVLSGYVTPPSPPKPLNALDQDFARHLATEVRQLLEGGPVDALDYIRENAPRWRAEQKRDAAYVKREREREALRRTATTSTQKGA